MNQPHSHHWRLLGAFTLSLVLHAPAAYLAFFVLNIDQGPDEGHFQTQVELVTMVEEPESEIEPFTPTPSEEESEIDDEIEDPADEEDETEIEDDVEDEELTAPGELSSKSFAYSRPRRRRAARPEPASKLPTPTEVEREEDERYQPREERLAKGQVVDTEEGGEEVDPKDPEFLSERSQIVKKQQRARNPGAGSPLPPMKASPPSPPMPTVKQSQTPRPLDVREPQPGQKKRRPNARPTKESRRRAKIPRAEQMSPLAKAPPPEPQPILTKEPPVERRRRVAKRLSEARPGSKARAARPRRLEPAVRIEPPVLLGARGTLRPPSRTESDREGGAQGQEALSVEFVSQPPPSPPVEATEPVRARPPAKATSDGRPRPRVKLAARSRPRPQAKVPPRSRPVPRVDPNATEHPEQQSGADPTPNDVEPPQEVRDEESARQTPTPQVELRPSFETLSQALGGIWLDHIEGVEDGNTNLLSTARWQHAPFFQRVKRQIAQHWHPAAVVARHDPGARVYGHRDRQTVVRIVLNDDGSLERVYVLRGSDADFLDAEAVRAVQQAAPFPNPPQGLVDRNTGNIVFAFGFNLVMGHRPLLDLRRIR